MPRSAAAGDPGPTHPAGSSGRGWSARQSQSVVAGREAEEGNQPVRAGTAAASPGEAVQGNRWRPYPLRLHPLRSHVAQSQPTPAPTGKEKEEDTVGRSP